MTFPMDIPETYILIFRCREHFDRDVYKPEADGTFPHRMHILHASLNAVITIIVRCGTKLILEKIFPLVVLGNINDKTAKKRKGTADVNLCKC
jgi:hypothetical protein